MKSRIADELRLRYSPVATIVTDTKPDGAVQMKQGTHGCTVAMFSAAARGKTTVLDRDTLTCGGGKIGMGFCTEFDGVPGGIDYFLSTGRGEGFPEGEGYKKTPDMARAFVEDLPTTQIPFEYVVYKPLEGVDETLEKPLLVSFLCNADQLSALVVLTNYGRATSDNVSIRFGAGCHTLFLLPYRESGQPVPKAVVGVTDISARPYVDADLLTLTVPIAMYHEMEDNVAGSFLEKTPWKKLRERIGK